MNYYNFHTDDAEYNRGTPKPMKREKSRDEFNSQDKRYKNDKRKRREAVERKRGF